MQYFNNNGLKAFFKKFIVFAVILLVIDFLVGGIMKHYYFKQKSGLLYCTTYSIDSTKADVLIFGSSKANHDYVPAIFASKLNTTVYNCGREGHSLIYYIAVMSAVLERYSPKQVIIDIKPDDFSISEKGQLSSLLPYHDNPAVDKYISYNGKFENYKLLSKMYPYNSLLSTIISNNLPSGKLLHPDDRGYVNYLNHVMPVRKKTIFKYAAILKYKVAILDDILKVLNEKNIAVTLVVSPSYYIYTNNDSTIAIIKSLCHKYSRINFFNYDNDKAYNASALYDDERHLNQAGAVKFSEDVCSRIMLKK